MNPVRVSPRFAAARRAAALGLVCLLAQSLAAAIAPVLTGEIDGARYTIARPDHWSGNLLLHAHGYRPEDAGLNASLDLADPAYARLLADGWIIATTSFRRNGIIVRDAIADLNALRDHIEQTEGPLSAVVLVGVSMGGAIVTLMAENEPGRFHGAVAIGAALQVRDPVYPLALTASPKIPLLFLSNESEIDGPAGYVERAAAAPVPPALWSIARPGHVNVNVEERSLALEGIVNWITTNTIERRRDATVAIDPGATDVVFADRSMSGRVRQVTASHGNLFTPFRPADLDRLGIAPGDTFELIVGDETYRVVYGTTYRDVERGGWVAFVRAEGVVLIARNFENAATTAGVAAGDTITIRPLSPP